MGHQRMQRLPASRKWREVVASLADYSDTETIAALSADAATLAFEQARTSPDVIAAIDLLARLPLAARSPDYLDELRTLGLTVDRPPSLLELTSQLLETLDRKAARRPGAPETDVGELARLAVAESVNAVVASRLPTLFGADPADVRTELGRLASGDAFAGLAREFFTRLTYRTLDYYLSRTLGDQMGPGKRFEGLADRRAFEAALREHCREATLIVRDYAAGWYGKQVYQLGGLTEATLKSFTAYSLKKIGAELGRRRHG